MKLKKQNSKNNNKYFNSYLKEDFDMIKVLNYKVFKKIFLKNLNIFICSNFFIQKKWLFSYIEKKNLNKWNSSEINVSNIQKGFYLEFYCIF